MNGSEKSSTTSQMIGWCWFTKKIKRPKIRPDARLPLSRAGGQGLYLRSLDHLGGSSEAKDRKKTKKVKCDVRTNGQTHGRTDGLTNWGVESRSTRLKKRHKKNINKNINKWTTRPTHKKNREDDRQAEWSEPIQSLFRPKIDRIWNDKKAANEGDANSK